MGLLLSIEDREYPLEYLLSRIRGRRAHLLSDWTPLIYEPVPLDYLATSRYSGFVADRTPANLWRQLLKEYRRVYLQMNSRTRDVFEPFFFHAELRTVFICLRHLRDRTAGTTDDLLEVSLLSDEIRRVLREADDAHSAVDGINRILGRQSRASRGIPGIAEAGSFETMERLIAEGFLTHAIQSVKERFMHDFFARIIDSRNIMSLAKQLRWQMSGEMVFLPGGSVSRERLGQARDREDMSDIVRLVREVTGIRVEKALPSAVENALYRGITRFLGREAKDPLGRGLILDYLWRCSLEVMNLGMIQYARAVGSETVLEEIIA